MILVSRFNVREFSVPFENLSRGVAELEVTDSDDREWKLTNEAGAGQPPNLAIFFR